MSIKFGTSGVRALVTDLTDREVYLLTTAFLNHSDSIYKSKSIATAIDLRESSPRLLSAANRAITDHGKEDLYCGAIPTPTLAFYAQSKNTPAIMITGSHIPADRNGLKFYLTTGETLKVDDEVIFKNYLHLKESNFASGLFSSDGSFKSSSDTNTCNKHEKEAIDLFTQRYLNFFTDNPLQGLRVVFYEHSSVARNVLPQILTALGAEVICKGRSDTFIPVDTEAVESLGMFAQWIKEEKADALVSTDGDGDRPLIIDNTGTFIPGDKIGMILCQLLEIEAIALPISCNSGIKDISILKEITYTRIGSPFVVDALNQLSTRYSRVAGFEANGGFILKSDLNDKHSIASLTTRDSALPIIGVLTVAARAKVTLSQLVSTLPPQFTSSVLIKNCATEKSSSLISSIQKNPSDFTSSILKGELLPLDSFSVLDGLRLSTNIGETLHLRPSGNAPEFRCYIEAETQERANTIATLTKKTLEGLLNL